MLLLAEEMQQSEGLSILIIFPDAFMMAHFTGIKTLVDRCL